MFRRTYVPRETQLLVPAHLIRFGGGSDAGNFILLCMGNLQNSNTIQTPASTLSGIGESQYAVLLEVDGKAVSGFRCEDVHSWIYSRNETSVIMVKTIPKKGVFKLSLREYLLLPFPEDNWLRGVQLTIRQNLRAIKIPVTTRPPDGDQELVERCYQFISEEEFSLHESVAVEIGQHQGFHYGTLHAPRWHFYEEDLPNPLNTPDLIVRTRRPSFCVAVGAQRRSQSCFRKMLELVEYMTVWK